MRINLHMAKCYWHYNGQCEAVATTTLKTNKGVIHQLCEKHYQVLIKTFGKIADGEMATHREHGESEANHWFVLNKIRK
jgi:hypothetical protein